MWFVGGGDSVSTDLNVYCEKCWVGVHLGVMGRDGGWWWGYGEERGEEDQRVGEFLVEHAECKTEVVGRHRTFKVHACRVTHELPDHVRELLSKAEKREVGEA